MNSKEYLQNSLSMLNITLDPAVVDRILCYFNDLLDKNKVVNLISRQSELVNSISVHLVDSLSPMQVELPKEVELLDLGSGGGLPGIPLEIANSLWKVTLVESKAKKSAFLKEMADKYGEGRVTVLTEFLQSNGRSLPDKQSFFDIVTVRAVGKLTSLISTVSHLIKSGGYLIAYKGPNYIEELKLAEKYLERHKLVLERKLDFVIPLIDASRTLLFFRKD
jgi:16S rRNA (guanine527-N7)-methyltransferase